MGIKEKIAEIRERRAEKEATKEREERLAQLERSCISGGFGYHPVQVSELPGYAKHVNDYILEKGKSDLRPQQLDKDAQIRDILYMMEIGGVLEWEEDKKAINELNYSKPICCDEQVYDNPVEMNLEYLLKTGLDLSRYDNIIGWHSQTLGIGQLTDGDVENMIEIKNKIGDKPYYHVIYSTTTNQFFWYALEKNPPPEKPDDRF